MEPFGAIVILSREEAHTPSLLLEPILFDPAARWLAAALKRHGARRFLVVCHPDDKEGATPCFPEGTVFVTAGTPEAQEAVERFREGPGQVKVIDSPVFWDETAPEPQTVPLERDNWDTLQALARRSSVRRLQRGGVRFIDPMNAYLGPDVTVGAGTAILPGTILRGETSIGRDCVIGPNTMITDCTVGDRVTINSSQLMESTLDDECTVGPFAYVRPGCHIGHKVKLGDFVELKNSTVGEGTKVPHLTYVGDSDVGSFVNFGCGSITVNYDGEKKFRTVIGDHVFLGCNTNLVAPVTVGDGVYTAAGSTITEDVPPESLAIARARQVVKKNWVKRRRED